MVSTINFSNKDTVDLRRCLRQEQTEAEKLLWNHLKNRRLGGLKFRRQHSIGPYIVDFFHSDTNTIIEVDGDVHFSLEDQVMRDERRTKWLVENGFKIVRYNNVDIFNNLNWILEEIFHNLSAPLSK